MTTEMAAMIEAVRLHAAAHYNEDGWDYVVEAMENCEIMEDLQGDKYNPLCTTNEEAIARMHWICKLLDERRKDIQGTIF